MINRQHAAIGGAEDPAEPVDPVEQSGDGVWDEEKSQALRQARKDAELTVSVDAVRVYLNRLARWRCSTRRRRCGSPP
ncbi:MAG: polymerase primary sigma factor [Pseudonocardiales bacterium]|jgi:hypothetical protein|nr:polymerase primary sigma factor [Pseudonocardiales bacterium]